MVRTFDRPELPAPPSEDAPVRRSLRAVLAWAAVLVALAVALTLAAVVVLGGSDSASRSPAVFTEHGRIKAH